jgi:hypothetical protein
MADARNVSAIISARSAVQVKVSDLPLVAIGKKDFFYFSANTKLLNFFIDVVEINGQVSEAKVYEFVSPFPRAEILIQNLDETRDCSFIKDPHTIILKCPGDNGAYENFFTGVCSHFHRKDQIFIYRDNANKKPLSSIENTCKAVEEALVVKEVAIRNLPQLSANHLTWSAAEVAIESENLIFDSSTGSSAITVPLDKYKFLFFQTNVLSSLYLRKGLVPNDLQLVQHLAEPVSYSFKPIKLNTMSCSDVVLFITPRGEEIRYEGNKKYTGFNIEESSDVETDILCEAFINFINNNTLPSTQSVEVAHNAALTGLLDTKVEAEHYTDLPQF